MISIILGYFIIGALLATMCAYLTNFLVMEDYIFIVLAWPVPVWEALKTIRNMHK